MITEGNNQKTINTRIQKTEAQDNSVCNSIEESTRLLKLFDLFIEIDKSINKQCNETNI